SATAYRVTCSRPSGRVIRTGSPNVGGNTLSPGPPAGSRRVRARIAATPPATARASTSYERGSFAIGPSVQVEMNVYLPLRQPPRSGADSTNILRRGYDTHVH